MTFWLCVTTEDNWRKCVTNKIWGTTDHYENTIKKAKVGDKLLFYVVGMKCGGIYSVSKEYFFETKRVWDDDIYPHRIGISPEITPTEAVDVSNLYYQYFPGKPQGYFRRAMREIPEDEFDIFREYLEKGKVSTMEPAEIEEVPPEFALSVERDLEEYITNNLDSIEQGLELFSKGDKVGRQFEAGGAGRIDILAEDKKLNLVVLELKAGKADNSTLGQILTYMGWAKKNIAGEKDVRGIIIASDFDEKLKIAASMQPKVTLKGYTVNFEFYNLPEY